MIVFTLRNMNRIGGGQLRIEALLGVLTQQGLLKDFINLRPKKLAKTLLKITSLFIALFDLPGFLRFFVRKPFDDLKQETVVGCEYWDCIVLFAVSPRMSNLVFDYHGLPEEEFAGKDGLRNKLKERIARIIDRNLYRRANIVMVPNNMFGDYLSKKYELQKQRILLPYLPPDLPVATQNQGEQKEWAVDAQSRQIRPPAIKLLFVGSLKAEGGIYRFMADNWAELNERCSITIVGAGEDSIRLEEFSDMGSVTRIDRIDREKYKSYLLTSDFLIAPEVHKLFSDLCPHMKLLDYLRCDRFVVTRKHAWMQDLETDLGLINLDEFGKLEPSALEERRLTDLQIHNRKQYLQDLKEQSEKSFFGRA